jgi:hypothetical protein
MGMLAERAGSHRVIQVATGIRLTAPLVGLALLASGAKDSTAVGLISSWVFMTIGIVMGSNMLGFFNHALELAPAGQRPAYIGLLNTMSGVLVVLPTIGGWILRATSFGLLFAITAAFLIIAHGLSYRLPAARRADAALQMGPAT